MVMQVLMNISKCIFLLIVWFHSLVVSAQKKEVAFQIENRGKDFIIDLIHATVDSVNYEKKIENDSVFTIRVDAQKHHFKLSYIGYSPWHLVLEVREDTSVICSFKPDVQTLNEVVVNTGSLFDRTRPEMGMQKISIEEMNKIPVLLGEIDIQRGLQTLPGVSSVGEGANGLNIRGGNVDQNLLLLDGNPIYNPTHLFGLFSVIPGEAIRSIDLYKGSVPVRFGGRAASVINIQSKEPSLQNIQMDGGLGLIASKLSLSAPLIKSKLGLFIAGRGSLTSGISKKIESLNRYQGSFSEVYTKMLFQPNQRNKLTFSYYGTTDHTTFYGINLNSEGNSAGSSEVSFSINNLALTWNRAFKNNSLFLNMAINQAEFKPLVRSPDSLITIQVENVIRKPRLSVEVIKFWSNQNEITFGGETGYNFIQPGIYSQNNEPIRSLTEERSLESALFFSWKMPPISKLNADIGLRYSIFNNLGPYIRREYVNGDFPLEEEALTLQSYGKGKVFNTYQGLEPRITISYLLNKEASFKASYTVNRQYIQIIANNTTPLPISRWKTSDTFTKPQVSSQYAMGYYQEIGSGNLQLSAEAYFRKTHNITDVKMGSDFLMKSFVETELLQGVNKSYGLEFMLSKRVGNTIFVTNYTYNRSLNRITGNSLFTEINNGQWYASNMDRPHSLNANIKIQQSPIHHFSFAFTFSSGRPFTAPENLVRLEERVVPVYGNRNNERIPAYHRLDFGWTINNPSRRGKKYRGNWSFNVYNLYAHKNIYSVFFNNESGSVQAYRLSVFASAIPSLSYNFIIR